MHTKYYNIITTYAIEYKPVDKQYTGPADGAELSDIESSNLDTSIATNSEIAAGHNDTVNNPTAAGSGRSGS